MTVPTFLKAFQKPAILVLAFVYLLVPLQKPLLEAFHKLEHAVLQSEVSYSHELAHEADVAHGHEHKAISFLSSLFSSDKNGFDGETLSKEIKFDKHFQKQYSISENLPNPYKKQAFFYISESYSVATSKETPPPKHYFS